ncbi:MAG: hypothetical protein ACXWJM_06000 [Ramlibacter sp.]
MKIHHSSYHWLLVALVAVAFLLTLSDAYGQATGSQAAFEGRPAMAGAQGGLGAQGGVPQGGIGVQGSEAAERGLHLRKPSGLEDRPQVTSELDDLRSAHKDAAVPRKDIGMKPGRDRSVAQDQRAIVPKIKRAAKRTITRARHGVSPIDTSATPATH